MPENLNYKSQLISYIKKNLKKGYTKESLKWALVGQGHSKAEIDRALNKAEQELAREAPILKTKPKITYEVVDSEPKEESSPEIQPEQKKKSFWERFFG